MNQVERSGDTRPSDPVQNVVSPTRPPRPASPLPQLRLSPVKAPNAAMLSLKLNLLKSSGEDDGSDTAPRSPSNRNKANVQRAVTEKRGKKRSIDGTDGPGDMPTGIVKRRKEGTPPVSPRSETPSPKRMVKQTRPVKDLKTMAGLSPRRAETASPPSSPRIASSSEPTASSTTSAPAWHSTGTPDVPRHVPFSSSSGAESGGRTVSTACEYAAEFTFTECDFRQDGELFSTQANPSRTPDGPAPSGANPFRESSFVSAMLISAELSMKAKAQENAAINYLSALNGQLAKTACGSTETATRHSTLEGAFKACQASLETAVMLCDMALQQGSAEDVAKGLHETLSQVAAIRLALAALVSGLPEPSASTEVSGAQKALMNSFDGLEIACNLGTEILAENQQAMPAPGLSVNSSAPKGNSSITPLDESLMDDLDKLLDKEI